MGVEVSIRDESGSVIDWFPSTDAVTWLLWAAEQAEDSPVATLIDEYGTTTVSHETIPKLIGEAERVVELLPHDTRKKMTLELIEFFRRAADIPTATLLFEGD